MERRFLNYLFFQELSSYLQAEIFARGPTHEKLTMTMAFESNNLNNNSEFINCLRKPVDHRTNEVSDINSF